MIDHNIIQEPLKTNLWGCDYLIWYPGIAVPRLEDSCTADADAQLRADREPDHRHENT